jgi:hypothetical protein
LADFVASNVRAFDYFGCVTEVLVPDQLRSAVSGTHRYDPDINPTYLEMAQHYGIAIIPARPRKPKDKAKVEVGVQVAQRWILACLRNRTFFGLDDLNAAIAELLERLNARPFQKLDGCRRSAFESIDRPAMKPLPQARYELADWKDATVNIDYHVDYEGRLYSVPYAMIGSEVEVRATDDGGDPARRRACRRTPSQLRPEGHGRHTRGAPAEVASGLRRVAAVAHGGVGGFDRSGGGERGRTHPGRQAASGAGLPLVHGAYPHGQAVRSPAHRGRVQARAAHRSPDAKERRSDPQARSRPRAR